ncbi:MAG: HEPN domain-containing protein, partial [Candidatus Omnitrophica bacterium]|nr:HEPN domain-containing protein [Candidatus Omnitrophota bacterium]
MSDTWLDLARDSRQAANVMVQHGRYRSAISRSYYAVYSRVTYELISSGVKMPASKEGPTHSKLPT